MGLLRHFYGILFKSWIHSEGELKASGMRQWLGTRGWGHDHPILCPRRLGLKDCPHGLFCPLTSSGIQSLGEATSRLSEGRRRVSLGFYSPSSLRAKSLSLATYCSQNMQILSGSPHYTALDPGTVPSSISSILGVEIVPNVANSVLVSLNPANTLISNPFNKLSSKYPI